MRDLVFNVASNAGLPFILRNLKGDDVTVLSLHRISNDENFFFDPIRPEIFEKLIQYCLRNYSIVSFADINKRTKKQKLVLSFDDGYYDFIEHAVPVLKKYGVPSNHNLVNSCLNDNRVIWTQQLCDLFDVLKINSITDDELITNAGCSFSEVNNNWMSYYVSFFTALLKIKSDAREELIERLCIKYGVESKYRMMTWEDAKYCSSDCDVEIGCHTYNHDSLFTLHSQEELDREIGKSLKEMEGRLGEKVNILAAPNGQVNDDVLKYCRQAGIKYFLLVGDKINPKEQLNGQFNLVNRIGLINEGIARTILRIELFHSKMRNIL